jgi:two-component system nitrate/nitrite response regulator NarL
MLRAADALLVVGEASDGEEAIQQTRDLLPDLLLPDLSMPRLLGLEAMRIILREAPAVHVLLLTSSITVQQTIDAIRGGARGIVIKSSMR